MAAAWCPCVHEWRGRGRRLPPHAAPSQAQPSSLPPARAVLARNEKERVRWHVGGRCGSSPLLRPATRSARAMVQRGKRLQRPQLSCTQPAVFSVHGRGHESASTAQTSYLLPCAKARPARCTCWRQETLQRYCAPSCRRRETAAPRRVCVQGGRAAGRLCISV